jgi:hypothetical protein
MARNIMLATELYPAGWYDESGQPVDPSPTCFLRVVDGDTLRGLAAGCDPPEAVRLAARVAHGLNVEDFDGTKIPGFVVRLVEEQHGQRAPIGWAPSADELVSNDGLNHRGRPVLAFCGDFIVAACAPQIGSQPEQGAADALAFGGLCDVRDRAGADPSEWPRDLVCRAFPV